jgi:hypothetical protein
MQGTSSLGKASGKKGPNDGRALPATIRESDGAVDAGKKDIELGASSVRLPFLPFLTSPVFPPRRGQGVQAATHSTDSTVSLASADRSLPRSDGDER